MNNNIKFDLIIVFKNNNVDKLRIFFFWKAILKVSSQTRYYSVHIERTSALFFATEVDRRVEDVDWGMQSEQLCRACNWNYWGGEGSRKSVEEDLKHVIDWSREEGIDYIRSFCLFIFDLQPDWMNLNCFVLDAIILVDENQERRLNKPIDLSTILSMSIHFLLYGYIKFIFLPSQVMFLSCSKRKTMFSRAHVLILVYILLGC